MDRRFLERWVLIELKCIEETLKELIEKGDPESAKKSKELLRKVRKLKNDLMGRGLAF